MTHIICSLTLNWYQCYNTKIECCYLYSLRWGSWYLYCWLQ